MPRLLLIVLLALCVVACGSGGPVKRVFPPDVRVQQIELNGPALSLRVQNFSTVPSVVEAIDLRLEIGGIEAARLLARPGTTVLPQAAEVLPVAATLSPPALERARAAIANGTALRYRLHGTITVEPNGRATPIDYSSALSPVPGLDGVLR
ncbi:MAG TPA: hypothetical protein DCM32_02380 [Xanthomonadaceae bacterium]|jgi:LEA14-like dessication related protein|nr:hypothetical protein [Xanthomonadaceae bacterium]